MILLLASVLLAADAPVLTDPPDIPMTVKVELRVVTSPVLAGKEMVIEGTVTNATDAPVSGCIGSSRMFRVEGAAETERIPLADDVGRCRERGSFSLEPGGRFRWKEKLPIGAIGAGPGRVKATFVVYQWRRRLADGHREDVRWKVEREAEFTVAPAP